VETERDIVSTRYKNSCLEDPEFVTAESPHRRLSVLDAPSNLGLEPPAPGKEPGVKHMARILRTHGLIDRLRAEDGELSFHRPTLEPEIQPAGSVMQRESGTTAYSLPTASERC
jgi:hypothetical protein